MSAPRAEPRAEPRAFGPAARPLFGWLHQPPADTVLRDAGLVICKPFGYEAVCAHRSLRHFADSAARMGIPALRFDYDGTGDSAGTDRDAGRWPAWLASVQHAVEEIRREEMVERVYLLGVRLGATLAATAAAERTDIAGLIGIVPVLSGRAWLRETNALEIAMRFPGPPPGFERGPGEQESVGFVITEETKNALQDVDLVKNARAPAQQILVLDRDDLLSNPKWTDRLSELGAEVDHRRVPGYAEMMLDPHESQLPESMLHAVSQWLDQRTVSRTAAAARTGAGSEVGPFPVAEGVEEIAGLFGVEGNLFGVVSRPARATPPSRAIVLLNAGGITHIGPSRLYVDLGRRWAARGYLVLRFDQAGVGDSAPFAGEAENDIYALSAIRGVREAVDFLREHWSATEFQALGLCSGAYHALKAAVAGLPLRGVAIVNPLVFFWKPGMSLAYPPYQVAEATARYRRSLLRPEKWMKLLAGKVDILEAVQVVARRTSLLVGALVRNVARTLGRPLAEDLGADLNALALRGIALSFVFASGDPGEDLLKAQAGWAVSSLERAGRLKITRIAGPNHAFTPVWTRSALTDVLEAELDVR